MARTNKRSGSNSQFPFRLHDLLTLAEAQGLEPSSVGWVLGGRGFTFNHTQKLMQILPVVFGQTKYKSVLRQLHMWGFDRISHGPNKGAYIHPYFVRGNRELCGQMFRQIGKRCDRTTERGRKPTTTDTCNTGELGSIKSQVVECSRRLKKSLKVPSFTSRRKEDEVLSRTDAVLSLLEETSILSGMLEPSSLTPKSRFSASSIPSLEELFAGSEYLLESQELLAKAPAPFPEEFSSLSFSASGDDLLGGISKHDSDVDCFAGKNFFLVEG